MISKRHELFVARYLASPTLDATQAAIESGYSPASAAQQAMMLLRRPDIQIAVREATKKKLRRHDITAERVLSELAAVAFSNTLDLYNDAGELRPIAELREEHGREIQAMETVIKNAAAGDGVQDRVLKIKTWDKLKALELLAKHLGLLVERVEVTQVHVLIEERLNRARQLLIDTDANHESGPNRP